MNLFLNYFPSFDRLVSKKLIQIYNKGGIYMENNYEDITLTCKDCGSEFVFTAGEQAFYAEKGFENQPLRCAECRRARKQQRNYNA